MIKIKDKTNVTIYRGIGNNKKDNKNIGTYWTTSKEEAEYYGSEILEREIETGLLMKVNQDDLDDYIQNWLESLDCEDRDYQESTKAYFYNQQDQILAAIDAKERDYAGLLIKNIAGEAVEITNYIILF